MKKTSHFRYGDQDKLNALTQLVIDNIDIFYDYFETKYYKSDKVILSTCFIHGGDNNQALNVYYDADYRAHYKCRTHECEYCFGTSIISLIRGGLSSIKHGWTTDGDKKVTFDQTIEFILKMLDVKFGDLEDSVEALNTNNHEFCRAVNIMQESKVSGNISREFYRKRVSIPSSYFINRDYSAEVLDKYDVGTCSTRGKPFYNRVVVPIYDDIGSGIVGFTGRSIFNRCGLCNSYHDPAGNCYNFPKWMHSKGFEKEKSLYNYYRAKPSVEECGVIILVESPGNVWRLQESGIDNSVALFGTSLNGPQKSLIDASGAMSVVIIMDNDEAGKKAALKIEAVCKRLYHVYVVNITKGDIGDMSKEDIQQEIAPIVNEAKDLYKGYV